MTMAVSVPVIAQNIEQQGFAAQLAKVHASEIGVLDLDRFPDRALPRIETIARRTIAADGVSSIVAGCAGMVSLTEHLRKALPVAVIDPVEAAAHLMYATARLCGHSGTAS